MLENIFYTVLILNVLSAFTLIKTTKKYQKFLYHKTYWGFISTSVVSVIISINEIWYLSGTEDIVLKITVSLLCLTILPLWISYDMNRDYLKDYLEERKYI